MFAAGGGRGGASGALSISHKIPSPAGGARGAELFRASGPGAATLRGFLCYVSLVMLLLFKQISDRQLTTCFTYLFFSIFVADEVDVIGYTSNQSDTDDHSSVQSSSDSGVAMSTSRLTLSEMMDNL